MLSMEDGTRLRLWVDSLFVVVVLVAPLLRRLGLRGVGGGRKGRIEGTRGVWLLTEWVWRYGLEWDDGYTKATKSVPRASRSRHGERGGGILGAGSVVLHVRFNCYAMLKQGWERGRKIHKILSHFHMYKKRRGIHGGGEVWGRGNRCSPPPPLSPLFIVMTQLGKLEVTVETNHLINCITRNLTRLFGCLIEGRAFVIANLYIPPPI